MIPIVHIHKVDLAHVLLVYMIFFWGRALSDVFCRRVFKWTGGGE